LITTDVTNGDAPTFEARKLDGTTKRAIRMNAEVRKALLPDLQRRETTHMQKPIR
jgi:hypothetical protein